ncbi:MAG: ABC transporter ATP-binding protein [Planctomycetota bacterium]
MSARSSQATAGATKVVDDFHSEDALDKPFDRRLGARLLSYVRPYWRQVSLSLGLIFISTALSLLTPIFVKEAIDGPLAPNGNELPRSAGWFSSLFGFSDASSGVADAPAKYGWLWGIVAIYAVVLVLQFLARYAQTWVMNLTGQNVMRDLRMQVFSHLQRQAVSFYQKQPVGRLVTRVTSDVEALNELFTSGLVTFLGDLLTLVGVVALLCYYNLSLALVALSVTPLLIGVTLLFRYYARRHYREIRRRLAHLNAYTQESIIGLDIIQICRREEERANGYSEINAGYLEAFLGSVFWYAIFFPAVEILATVALALVLFWSSDLLSEGVTTFGEFFLFWTYLNKFFVPMRELAEKYNILQAAMAASERIFGLLDDDHAISEQGAAAPAPAFKDAIRFEGVNFSYDGQQPVLRDVSFEIRRGETVALVGATGAGKSTIVNLLLRFHDPTHGRVLVDGKDIRETALSAHRARFGLVLQDVSIFSRDVRENIDLDRGLGDDVIKAAAEHSNALPVIDRLPAQFKTRMAERGRSISSGERQLLSFARALAGDPEVLVLDEATSHIDTETETLIREALNRLTRNRTSVIIAHRLSTIRTADRILVFHHGELREQGRHAELLAKGGIYARLHQLQFGA